MTNFAEDLLLTYILAKDGNRPHLLRQAFAEDARLDMVVNTGAISFPPAARSLEQIADILVRQFGATYENVYTFCLDRPAANLPLAPFSCGWLVGMSEKASGNVRVGCGRYDWHFSDQAPWRIDRLKIVIDAMEILPPENGAPIFEWLSALPYPWCPPSRLIGTAPAVEALRPVIAQLGA